MDARDDAWTDAALETKMLKIARIPTAIESTHQLAFVVAAKAAEMLPIRNIANSTEKNL